MDRVEYFKTDTQAINLIDANYQKFAFQKHYHLDFHLGLITKGQQTFRFGGEKYTAGQGQMIVMPPDEIHDGESKLDTGYQVRVFSIEPEWLSQLAELNRSQTISFNQLIIDDPLVFNKLCALHKLLLTSNLSQLAKDGLPLEGFELLFQRYGSSQTKTPVPLGEKSLQTLRDYLMANLDQAVKLSELSDLVGLSPTKFQRHFKAKTGFTPYAWLSRLRLEQSMRLLKSGVPSTEVAQEVGFYDQAHFCKAFKIQFGVSPSKIN